MRPQGNKKVIAALNARLSDEFRASLVYQMQACLYRGMGLTQLADHFFAESKGERVHAEMLMERLTLFGATPAPKSPPLEYGDGPKGMIEFSLGLERNAVKRYNEAAQIAASEGDEASRSLFASLARDEEQHYDWLQTQLDQIDLVGQERYFSERGDQGTAEKSLRVPLGTSVSPMGLSSARVRGPGPGPGFPVRVKSCL